jgi:hypothetical protein
VGFGDYTWQDLVDATRRKFGTPHSVLYLPRAMASAIAWLSQKTSSTPLLTQGNVNQMYYPDWVVRPVTEPRTNLEAGILRTIEGYVRLGWIPSGKVTQKTTAKP